MNLHLLTPKNETEDLLFSSTENYETLFKQTHRKTQETMELRLSQSEETSSFKSSNNLGLGSEWMIGLTVLTFYGSNFVTTEENKKFVHFTEIFDESSFTGLKDEVAEIFGFRKLPPNFYNMI